MIRKLKSVLTGPYHNPQDIKNMKLTLRNSANFGRRLIVSNLVNSGVGCPKIVFQTSVGEYKTFHTSQGTEKTSIISKIVCNLRLPSPLHSITKPSYQASQF